MNHVLKLKTSWEDTREKILEIRPDVRYDDIELMPGEESEMIDKLAAKMKKTPEAIIEWIESISSTLSIAR